MPWKNYAVFGAVCALVIGIYCWSAEPGFYETVCSQGSDSYYNLLVQGFRDGQLNVKRDPPSELAGLANPYDPATNAPYIWDIRHISYELSYYKGKLYLYQGVTPALVFFWPYAALTGEYCTHKAAAVIFLVLGFLVAAGLMFVVWRRYFAETSVWLVATTVLALGLASGFMETLSACDEHKIPHVCGFAFAMLALAAIWNSLHHSRWQIIWLAGASLAYGLAVGARPSLLFGIIILLVPVVQEWRAWSFKRACWLLLAAIVPAALIGVGLAEYNQLRFGSPFEFGWRYVLTDVQNEFAQPFSLSYCWFNWKLYFLEPVYWNSHFPFLRAAVPSALPANYYGVGGPYCGILLNYPLAWLALAALWAWKGRTMKDMAVLRSFLAAIFLLFAVNALTLCCFFSGSSIYMSDFLAALMMLAVIGIWSLDRVLRAWPLWCRLARLGCCLLMAYSVAVGVLSGIKTRAYALHTIGNSLSHMGRDDEAIINYRKSVALDSSTVAYRIGLGNACVKLGNIDEAVSQYNKGIENAPDNIEALYYLSLSLIQCGRVEAAAVYFQRALSLNPGFLDSQNPAIINNFAWGLASAPETRNRNGQMAVALAEAACRKTKYQTTMMVGTLAAAYAEAGRFDDAIATAQKACDLALQSGDQVLWQRNQELLALYHNHQAYRENPASLVK